MYGKSQLSRVKLKIENQVEQAAWKDKIHL